MLSQTTHNFAERRGYNIDEVTIQIAQESRDTHDCIWIFNDNNDSEPDVSYIVNTDGSFTFKWSLLHYLISEELPARLEDEKQLRILIDFLSTVS